MVVNEVPISPSTQQVMSSQFTDSGHSDDGPNSTSLPSRSTSTSFFQAVTKRFSSPKNSVATSFPQPSPTIVVRHESSSVSFSNGMNKDLQRSFTSLGAHGMFGGKPADIDDRLNIVSVSTMHQCSAWTPCRKP